ncbi:CDP-glycerol glycerophosphotransferase family protein [Marinilactibacillus psychrotolerans]|uniref:CDP-glycerol glycerophosphotransferase family protein n=1 Tax=Marinilactibacillus psychrotolerans TaxID=191770 RepID=UPI0038879C1D
MELMKNIKLSLIRFILKSFYLIPIKKSKILFIAFDGRQFSCNPKYIYNYIKDRDMDRMQVIWVFNKPEAFHFLGDDGVKVIRNKSLSFLYHILTSQVVITNASLGSYIPLRKNQKFIETWHGGGAYKKTGRIFQESKLKDRTLSIIANELTGFISSSKVFTETKSKHHLVPKEKFWEIGMPRNDVLFDKEKEEKLREKVKNYYNIDKDTKIVMYAPTLRNDKDDISSYESLDTELLINALKERFGGEKWVVFFRMHYLLDANKNLKHTINVSKYDDSQELVCASDVLISDYSSIMWDFTFTNRPCFVFAPDAERYKEERAFFTPMEKWPYAIAFDNEQLSKNILNFNFNRYMENVEKHHKTQGSFEQGISTKKVYDKISQWVL